MSARGTSIPPEGPGTTGSVVVQPHEAASFRVLEHEFAVLERHLGPLRTGVEGGLTALRSRLNRLTIAALAADDHGAYVAVNEAAASISGFSVRDLQTMSVWDLTPAADTRNGRQLWAAFLEAGEQRGICSLQGLTRSARVAYLALAHVLPHVHVSLLIETTGASPDQATQPDTGA